MTPQTRLVDPHVRHQHDYLEASDELAASTDPRKSRDGDGEWHHDPEEGYDGFTFTRSGLEDPEEFARFVDRRLRARDPRAPRQSRWVPTTFLWVVDEDDTYVGSLSIRHELNDHLARVGGHIGYSVRPSARRRGHATRALAASLPHCAALGIDPVLVTCWDWNEPSRRSIEANGGTYDGTVEGTMRFWIHGPLR